jgi:hypothetical protein
LSRDGSRSDAANAEICGQREPQLIVRCLIALPNGGGIRIICSLQAVFEGGQERLLKRHCRNSLPLAR